MPLKNIFHVYAITLSFILLVTFQRWNILVAYLSSVLMFWTHAQGETSYWPVFAWFSYSFVFWSVAQNSADNVLLLTVASLAQAAAIGICDFAPSLLEEENKQLVSLAGGVVLMVPFRCNNLHYSPVTSLFRLGMYFLTEYFDADRHWLARQYPLFGTQEVVLFLFAWHVFHWVRVPKEDPLVLPLTTEEKICADISQALNKRS